MQLPDVACLRKSSTEPSLGSTTGSSIKLPQIGHHSPGGHDHSGNSLGSTLKRPYVCKTEFTMQPPASLKNAVVLNRLDEHIHTFHSNSFAVYSKEYDIASGIRKHRMDPAQMRRAENNYVSSLHALVGPAKQPGLKMYDSPDRKAKRHEEKQAKRHAKPRHAEE